MSLFLISHSFVARSCNSSLFLRETTPPMQRRKTDWFMQ